MQGKTRREKKQETREGQKGGKARGKRGQASLQKSIFNFTPHPRHNTGGNISINEFPVNGEQADHAYFLSVATC